MRYSDENQQGLMSLLAASQRGLDPTTAFSILQNIQQDQEQQNLMRQERQTGLIGLLRDAAMSGMPYEGAAAMMEAAPGPMGPALDTALATMYPSGAPEPARNASGAIMDFPSGSRPTPSGVTPEGYAVPVSGAASTSPLFQPEPVPFTEQQAMMEMEQEQALQADLTMAQAEAARARAEQWTVDDYIAKSQTENPELWAAAPEEMMAIAVNTFGEAAVQMRGVGV